MFDTKGKYIYYAEGGGGGGMKMSFDAPPPSF
jgi:hypothetical protein